MRFSLFRRKETVPPPRETPQPIDFEAKIDTFCGLDRIIRSTFNWIVAFTKSLFTKSIGQSIPAC